METSLIDGGLRAELESKRHHQMRILKRKLAEVSSDIRPKFTAAAVLKIRSDSRFKIISHTVTLLNILNGQYFHISFYALQTLKSPSLQILDGEY